jgi:NAD(P)-dependent dehydrogenase (short-subunit alcohol dehydrogenase family)
MNLTGRTAVVTGGASGIGYAVAARFAADGAAVAIWDLDLHMATEAAERLRQDGCSASAYGVDIADRSQVDRARDATNDDLGIPTILVANAGKEYFGSFLRTSQEQWDEMLRINLTGTFHCCQSLVPGMIEQGWGRIVTISSSAAQGGREWMTAYVASKAGVIGLTQSLARELGPKGITANTIPPEFIDTPMLRQAEADGLLGKSIAMHEADTPVRRVGRPEDIAGACAYLVSEEAGYVTGQIIGVNGGRRG